MRRGDEAVLVTLRNTGKMLPQWPDSKSVRVLHRRSTFLAIPALSKLLRNEEMDVLISAQDHANVAAMLARKLSRKKIPLILTERLSLRAAMKARGWFRRKILSSLVAYAYPRADAVVANSQDGASEVESVLGWSAGRVSAIYNPTVSESISGLGAEDVDDEWFDPGGSPVVIGLGRLVEQKDFSTLVRAIAGVQESAECRLVIFGDGPLRSELKRLANDLGITEKVRIEPFVENPYKYLSRGAVFVLSSRYEGLPNALIEAQACGLPCVSTDCPTGPREILEDGGSGILTPMGDSELMAESIAKMLDDRNLAQAYVTKATAGLSRFTPAKCYSSYRDLVEWAKSPAEVEA